MIWNVSYWTSVFRRIIYVALIFISICIALKLSVFYMPFLVAFIISLIIEPLIKYIMKKTKLSRRVSSIIIFLLVSFFITGSLIWLITTLFSESYNLLNGLNNNIDKAYIEFQNFISKFDFNKIHLSEEIIEVIQNSTGDIITNISNWIRNILTGVINFITKIPRIAICIGITVVALYFICVDKIYILDQIEHHLPKMWVKKISVHMKELIKTLGGYLKAQAILILITFGIVLIGLNILSFIGFNIEYPLLMALFIGFIDALPILGAGVIIIPWAIISAINGDIKLGIALIGLLIITSIIKQVLEPKLVSKNIGIHPIFTLIAMYTGFKFIGVFGLLIGPIVLIIFKNLFSSLIEQGVLKTIFDRK